MNRGLVLGVALLSLALCSLAARAASPDPLAEARAAIFAPAPETGAPAQAEEVAARHRLNVKSTCTATCRDGSTVSCYGTTCSAVNAACSSGQRGYCTGTSTGTIYCPACPTNCSARATCSPSGSVSCSGTSGDCFSVNNCYAYCDGNYYLCPHTASNCPP
ncbi:MAG TPA: hypothetical protein VHC97_00565 [Thermoanaerobaculia bacterium]|jgi:hypothetical protein|nr:hypothetical protein [Thermoanaerobaculia bacterium]